MNFASDLLTIARKSKSLDRATDAFLSTCKELEVRTVEYFEQLVAQAYAENNWSQKIGRPAKGSTLKPAPEGARSCVKIFRRALALGLVLADYKTVYAMREAIKSVAGPAPVDSRPSLAGVVLRNPHTLTGALWHDSIALSEELPDDVREEYEAAVRKVMERFLPKAPPTLAVA